MRFNHGVLTLITILIIGIVILNNIIALPFLLIYPLFYSRKSKTFAKILSGLLYSFLIFIFLFSAFVKLIFSSNKLLLQKSSPNKKYNIVVIDNDQGALGGNTIVELEKIYFNSIKKQRIVYIDRWGKSLEIEWIDNENVKIDENIINVNRKDKIDKRNSL
ncbi:DUF5412 family protein [Clostridium malenominatum]|uniref:DUF5412 family protein n=1 Tax=Clostridium malenominatum TaxID=1539 RepID=UPI0031DA9B90